jgi:hypothetical protein
MDEPIQSTEQPISNCPECNADLVPGKILCVNCAYPVYGTTEQKSNFELTKHSQRKKYDAAMASIRNARNALYVMAGFMGIFGIIFSVLIALGVTKTQGGDYSSPIEMAIPVSIAAVVMFALFGGLGFWSKKNPFTPLLIASILFFLMNISNVSNFDYQPESFITAGIFLGIFILQLIGAIAGYGINKQKQLLNIK